MNDTTQQAPAAPKGYQILLDGKPVDIAAIFTSHDRDKRLIGDLERALELVKNDRRIAEVRVTELERERDNLRAERDVAATDLRSERDRLAAVKAERDRKQERIEELERQMALVRETWRQISGGRETA